MRLFWVQEVFHLFEDAPSGARLDQHIEGSLCPWAPAQRPKDTLKAEPP